MRTLVSSLVLVGLVAGPAAAQRSYNPTASDPVTGNTAGGGLALLFARGTDNAAFGRAALG